MKITFLGPAHPYRGGIATFNERLARQFISESKEVDIRTFSLQYPGLLFPGKSQYTSNPPPDDIMIRREINSINPVNWLKMGYRLKKERPDILLVRYWTPFLAPCFATVARIVRSNKYTVVISLVDNAFPHEKHMGDRFLTKCFLNSIDGATVMSDTVRLDVIEFRNDIPVCIAPHPLYDNYGQKISRDEALAGLKLDPDFSYLLFFGFIRDYKGLDILLKAFSHPELKNKKLKLLVAGEFYENEAPYRELVKESGIEEDVIFFNRFIKDEEVKLFFCASDLVVQPYKTATQSGVTQIAFNFDKPMLVTNVGGLKDMVSHKKCGYVVDTDPDEIAMAILDYFDNDRKNEFSDCVSKEKMKFSWNRVTDAITEVFYRCLLKQLITTL